MSDWFKILLAILALSIPAFVVFITVYNILKQYLDGQYRMRLLEYQQSRSGMSMPARMQAYERLTLFCERISLPNLLYHFPAEGLNAAQLKLALMLSIQNEFEYNVTQQVYVSEALWEIIKLAKDDVFNSISIVYDKVAPHSDASELSSGLIKFYNERNSSGPEKALLAIRKEAALLF